MHPILFQFKYLVIHTYGFFMALAFLAALVISKREARLADESPEIIGDLIFWILVAAIVGSRFFHVVIYHENYFPNNLLGVFEVWEGGLVFYGGFVFALGTAVFFLRKHKMPTWKVADVLTPAVPFGHFLGRLGCFSAGCCHGKECSLPWAVVFDHPETLAIPGVPLHPTQIYSSAANLLIFFAVMALKRYKRFHGQVFWIYVIVYAVTRSVLEMFRGDFRGEKILGLFSTSQFIALIMVVTAFGALFFLSKKYRARSVA